MTKQPALGNEPKPSYYAIIPASVRYDKKVPPQARLLYGEITALCNKNGYCTATNSYFAELYEVEIETVSRWVSTLAKQEHIEKELIYREGTNEIIGRKIYITDVLTKKSIAIDKMSDPSIDKKVNKNNTEENNTEQTARQIFVKTKRGKNKEQTDQEFLDSLVKIYDWVDVPTELEKANAWCIRKGRRFTRGFFADSWMSNFKRDTSNDELKMATNGNGTPSVVPDNIEYGVPLLERAAKNADNGDHLGF